MCFCFCKTIYIYRICLFLYLCRALKIKQSDSDTKESPVEQKRSISLPKPVIQPEIKVYSVDSREDATDAMLVTMDNFFPKHTSVTLGHLLRSHILAFRTSMDSLTELEMNMLMAFGYQLADSALQSSHKYALMGGQFSSVADIIPSGNAPWGDVTAQDKDYDEKIDRELFQTLLQIHGCERDDWGFVNTKAEKENKWGKSLAMFIYLLLNFWCLFFLHICFLSITFLCHLIL